MGVSDSGSGEYISYRNTMVLRFLLFVAILVFHAGDRYGFQFPNIGYLCVAGFFFMSGYGLELSRCRKEGYMRTFLQRRVLGLMIQYWIIMVVTALIVLVLGGGPDRFVDDILKTFLRHPYWFVTELVVFYVVFYLASLMGNDRSRLAAILVSVCILMLAMTEYFGTNLYLKSGACFFLGILWYSVHERIESAMSRFWPVLILLSSAVLCLSLRNPFDPVDMVECSLTGAAFMILLLTMCSMDLRRSFPVHILVAVVGAAVCIHQMGAGQDSEGAAMMVFSAMASAVCGIRSSDHLQWLGALSLELYIMHFVFFDWLPLDDLMPVSLAMVVVLVLSVAVAYPTNRLCGYVMSGYNDRLKARNMV